MCRYTSLASHCQISIVTLLTGLPDGPRIRPVRCVISPDGRGDPVVDDDQVVVGVQRQLVRVERTFGPGRRGGELLGEQPRVVKKAEPAVSVPRNAPSVSAEKCRDSFAKTSSFDQVRETVNGSGVEEIRSLVRIIARVRLFRRSAAVIRASWRRAARAGSTADCREIKRLAEHLIQRRLLVFRKDLFDLLDRRGTDLLLTSPIFSN